MIFNYGSCGRNLINHGDDQLRQYSSTRRYNQTKRRRLVYRPSPILVPAESIFRCAGVASTTSPPFSPPSRRRPPPP
ncbi:hypothetical protein MIMGU_mgv1a017409mg [Erythranthe guttata]|uniref:Uncharacterized protein n=1 Tax=Erythranthe guttata TaxID=4155 RepID=A0A022RK35_ERYGU|nr:hypothetical protein MIMGU_mgv1a017409mg [Erythranthe guttata]